jgi:predicted ATPase
LLTVTGPGGIGKTRLVLECVELIAAGGACAALIGQEMTSREFSG